MRWCMDILLLGHAFSSKISCKSVKWCFRLSLIKIKYSCGWVSLKCRALCALISGNKMKIMHLVHKAFRCSRLPWSTCGVPAYSWYTDGWSFSMRHEASVKMLTNSQAFDTFEATTLSQALWSAPLRKTKWVQTPNGHYTAQLIFQLSTGTRPSTVLKQLPTGCIIIYFNALSPLCHFVVYSPLISHELWAVCLCCKILA